MGCNAKGHQINHSNPSILRFWKLILGKPVWSDEQRRSCSDMKQTSATFSRSFMQVALLSTYICAHMCDMICTQLIAGDKIQPIYTKTRKFINTIPRIHILYTCSVMIFSTLMNWNLMEDKLLCNQRLMHKKIEPIITCHCTPYL